MLTTPSIDTTPECIAQLIRLLTPNELCNLIGALSNIIDGSGYGEIKMEIKRRRIEQIAITETLKPGAK